MKNLKTIQAERKQTIHAKLIEELTKKYESLFGIPEEEAKEVVRKTFPEWYPNV